MWVIALLYNALWRGLKLDYNVFISNKAKQYPAANIILFIWLKTAFDYLSR